ncbi:MAG: type II secretion system protein [Candidatus Omnitrophota bacterium]
MKKSLTLIEIIVVLVVFSLAIPPLVMIFSNLASITHESEMISNAQEVVNYFFEEIRSKRFDENIASPWTDYNSLGYEAGSYGLDALNNENSADHHNWDDVDDYHSYTAVFEHDPAYQVSIQVFYVEVTAILMLASATRPIINMSRLPLPIQVRV